MQPFHLVDSEKRERPLDKIELLYYFMKGTGGGSVMTRSKKKHVKSDSLSVWYHKRDKALARVVAIYENDEATGDELNEALDCSRSCTHRCNL